MGWKIVERRIGRAGGEKERLARQHTWDRKYGADAWEVGYVVDGVFLLQDEAYETVYQPSYAAYFTAHPEVLVELAALAKSLRNPHAEATTGVDLQTPAVLRCLRAAGLELHGDAVVDVGSWQGERSHSISVRLSPLAIPCVLDDKLTLEAWWQSKKCLAVWTDSEAES